MDSEDLTMAVNFWWRSDMMSGMPEHMDAYYLRRIMKRCAFVHTSFECASIYEYADFSLCLAVKSEFQG